MKVNGSLTKWVTGAAVALFTSYMGWIGISLIDFGRELSDLSSSINILVSENSKKLGDHEVRIRSIESATYRGMDGRVK